jgi:hypothetical protein
MNSSHDFNAQLTYSHSQADRPYWHGVYQQAFPDMQHMLDLRHNGWHQRAGRDRMIVLSSGRAIYIDEKVRRKSFPDIAVEVWSTYPKGGEQPYRPVKNATEGWGQKPLDCDYLAYAFEPTKTCHLIPFLGLRAAWEKRHLDWIQQASRGVNGFRWVVASNQRYDTVSIAVPIGTLLAHINDALTVTWQDASGLGEAS